MPTLLLKPSIVVSLSTKDEQLTIIRSRESQSDLLDIKQNGLVS